MEELQTENTWCVEINADDEIISVSITGGCP